MMKQARRIPMEKAGVQEAVNTYMSSLADLTVNSKPHINALTMLAEDYLNYAEAIVNAVDDHLKKVPSEVKLPILYLIDSIIKNVGKVYITLFSRTIVQSFSMVFEQVDEKTRQQMYKLRQTWNEIFPEEHLYAMDLRVRSLDPKWPITANPALQYVAAAPATAAVQQSSHKIHINPKFLQNSSATAPVAAVASAVGGRVSPALPSKANPPAPLRTSSVVAESSGTPKIEAEPEALLEQLLQRKRNLLQLQQEKEQTFKNKKPIAKAEKSIAEYPSSGATHKRPTTPDVPSIPPTKSDEETLMAKAVRLTLLEEEKKETKKKETLSTSPDIIQILPVAPRIAPVSSGLINLVTSQRAQRDPRLSKQLKEDVSSEDSTKSQGRSRDPRLTSKAEKRSRSSEKETSSKGTHTRSRDESSERTSSRHSSRREREKRSSDSRKSNRKSEERSLSRSKKTSSHSPSKSSGTRSPSKSSSSRSPGKSSSSRSKKTSSSCSPSKSSKSSGKQDRRGDSSRSPRKSSYSGHRPVSDCVDSQESDASDSIERAYSPISPRGGTSGSEWPVNFSKGSRKGRNYVRRNLPEKSPEVSSTVSSDVDLRVGAPPEKQIRLSDPLEILLQSSSSALSTGAPEQILPTIACQDVDLRCLPSSPGKKRRSAEPEDGPPPNKKNKAARIESLFGKQDVDLRQMNMNNGITAEAPSPPPPPIISSPDCQAGLKSDNLGWSKFKQTQSPSPTVERSPAFPRSSRHDRLGHSVGESDLNQREDTDMRVCINGMEGSSKTDYQGILRTATEQYKNGTISHADFSRVQKQLFHMHESEKIREAQRNDYTRRDTWERRPREKDYRHGMASPDDEQFGDVDLRNVGTRPAKKPLLPLPNVPPVALPDTARHSRYMGPRMAGPMQGQGFMRPPRSVLGGGVRGHTRGTWRYPRGGPSFKENTIALPSADPFILERIAHDPMRTITIDNVGREIRFYGEDAVAFLSADNPCEIAFDPGDATVILNDIVINCSFHQPAKEINIGGKIYRVRLGAPTRELYVNDEGFECQFNCPAKEILLATGDILLVQLQSDSPPMVHVGAQRRDLVAGRVMLIIDAENAIPIFLDAKPQRFDIDGVPHVIKFADALDTVLVNNHPFNIKFGGPAVPITVNDMKHYIRLTELPAGVVPGEVEIVSMSHFRTKAPASRSAAGTAGAWTGPTPTPQVTNQARVETDHEPALPVRGGLAALNRGVPKKIVPKKGRRDHTESMKPARVEDRQMPAELLQAIQPGLPSLLGLLPGSNNSGYSSAASSASSGPYGVGAGSVGGSVGDTTAASSSASSSVPAAGPESTTSAGSNGIPFLQPDLNKLIQSLYDTGLISKKNKVKAEDDKKKVHHVDFKDSKSLKINQPAIIDILYSGIQCSSCGTRFPPEQTEKYSAHLDWHFRQNRRDKDSQRKPQSRKWYYDVSDWIQFEEIDDAVDKAQNWFDTQQTETAKFEEAEEEEVQSVPSKDFPEGTICELCHDRFDQFYNEEKEEWHLKDCMAADGIPYHPFCYKDHRVSVESNDNEPPEAAEGTPDTEETADNPSEDQEMPLADIKKEPEDDTSAEKTINEVKAETEVPMETDAEAKVPVETKVEDETQAKAETNAETNTEAETNAEAETKVEAETKTEAETKADVNHEECGDASGKEEQDSASNVDDLPSVIIKQEVPEDEPAEEGLGETSSEINSAKEEDNNAKENEEEGEKVKEKEEEMDVSEVEKGEQSSEIANTEEGQLETKSLEEETVPPPVIITNPANVSCSIDGNLELSQAPAALQSIPNRIKINISKPIVKLKVETEDESEKEDDKNGDTFQPEPSEDEPVVLKPMLVGRKLTVLPPKLKGTETSGLCSIM